MPKKVVKKAAKKIKRKAVKVAVEKPAAKQVIKQVTPQPVQDVQEIQEPVQEVKGSVQEEIQSEPAPVQPEAEPISQESIIKTKEETKMSDEKGVGKDYDPTEFSQPAVQAGGSSKMFVYVGISIVVIGLIIAGLFFGGIFKGGASESLTGATVVTAYCTDTDGGYNRFTKGVAEGTYYLDYSEGTFMDECASGEENKLTEYYCKNDLIVYATEPCPEGMSCVDGICQ